MREKPFNIEISKAEENRDVLGGLVGCGSHKGIKSINEDFCRSANLEKWKILVLADGVGSARRAEESSRIAVDAFYETLTGSYQKRHNMSAALLKKCYREAFRRLESASGGGPSKAPEFQTTLIAVVEVHDRFFITYLGDGDIWIRRGDGWAIPVMMPHKKGTLLTGGLTDEGIKGNPVYIEYSKSFKSGETVIVGTDGVFEIKGDISTLISELKKIFQNNQALTDSLFNELLNGSLEHLHEKYGFGDNATLGVMVSEKALTSFQNK